MLWQEVDTLYKLMDMDDRCITYMAFDHPKGSGQTLIYNFNMAAFL